MKNTSERTNIRITSGQSKNVRLQVPEIDNFRAVQDVVKQSIFSSLGEKITDATCLDLYAGSGSLGIEALSRGAKFCDFVDESPKAKETIKANLIKAGYEVYEQKKHKEKEETELESTYEAYRSKVYESLPETVQPESDFGIHTRDSIKFAKRAAEENKKYDIIFADPFYEDLSHKFLMKNLAQILSKTGYIVFLHGNKLDIKSQIADTPLKIISERKFGNGNYTVLAF